MLAPLKTQQMSCRVTMFYRKKLLKLNNLFYLLTRRKDRWCPNTGSSRDVMLLRWSKLRRDVCDVCKEGSGRRRAECLPSHWIRFQGHWFGSERCSRPRLLRLDIDLISPRENVLIIIQSCTLKVNS